MNKTEDQKLEEALKIIIFNDEYHHLSRREKDIALDTVTSRYDEISQRTQLHIRNLSMFSNMQVLLEVVDKSKPSNKLEVSVDLKNILVLLLKDIKKIRYVMIEAEDVGELKRFKKLEKECSQLSREIKRKQEILNYNIAQFHELIEILLKIIFRENNNDNLLVLINLAERKKIISPYEKIQLNFFNNVRNLLIHNSNLHSILNINRYDMLDRLLKVMSSIDSLVERIVFKNAQQLYDRYIFFADKNQDSDRRNWKYQVFDINGLVPKIRPGVTIHKPKVF